MLFPTVVLNLIFYVINWKVINVTFFNEFGESFLKAMDTKLEIPVIITICFVKVSVWKGMNYSTSQLYHTPNKYLKVLQYVLSNAGTLYLTNFPSTRFYLNSDHYSVSMLRKRFLRINSILLSP